MMRARSRRWLILLRRPDPPGATTPSAASVPVGGVRLDDHDIAGIATDLWRARRKAARAGDDMARQVVRHLDSLQDRLAQAGVEFQDHDGLRVDPGMDLDVVAWEERSEIDQDVVVETVAPSVYCGKRLIQIGQVVVARPMNEEQ